MAWHDDSVTYRKLILIRHSVASRSSELPWYEWPLSEEGRRLCIPLAARVGEYCPSVIVTSTERKAIETGQLVASELGLRTVTCGGLQENDRTGLPELPREEIVELIARFLKGHSDSSVGNETAAQAFSRFTDALSGIVSDYPGGNIAVVTHGTVLSLFVSARTGVDPVEFWSSLAIPSLVVMSLPGYRLIEVVPRII